MGKAGASMLRVVDLAPTIQMTARQRMLSYKLMTGVAMAREARSDARDDVLLQARADYADGHGRVAALGPLLERADVDEALAVIAPFARWAADITPETAAAIPMPEYDDLALRRAPAQIAALNVVIAALEARLKRREDRAQSDRAMASGVASDLQAVAGKINLIALNARIEAARQGDAGRAFSVIANEIKTLSDHSRVKADEIAWRLSGEAGGRRSADASGV